MQRNRYCILLIAKNEDSYRITFYQQQLLALLDL